MNLFNDNHIFPESNKSDLIVASGCRFIAIFVDSKSTIYYCQGLTVNRIFNKISPRKEPTKDMVCPNCGTNLPGGALFCSSCGANLSASPRAGGGRPGAGGIQIDSDGRGVGRGYKYEVLHSGAFALALIQLQAEQSIQAEAGAMVSMSGNVELQSQMKGGIMGALKRAVGGESAFVSTFTARGGPGEVSFAPGAPGDVAAIEMSNQIFYVQSSSYLAGDTSLTIDTRWGGAKSFFGGEGLFVLQVQGSGLLLVSSFGSIHRKKLNYGETYVVDTGHLVAWEGHLHYDLRKASSAGWFRSMVSGEGIVAEFTGPGEILIQTRNLAAFAGILKPFFPSQSGGIFGE
jgi:uncharacterized protein (TIGR00266 family)